jgi:hypothetical protein
MKDLHEYGKIMETVFIASIFAIVNILMRPTQTRVVLYIVEVFISVTFATLMGVLSAAWVTEPVVYAITAASALLARDFITFVMGFGHFVTEKRELIFVKLLDYLLGKGNK